MWLDYRNVSFYITSLAIDCRTCVKTIGKHEVCKTVTNKTD